LFDDELTALHVAAWCGHLDCVKVLVEEGSDIEAVSSKYGTPLCVAAFRRHKDIVEALIRTYNADVNAQGGWLGSPAHAASFNGDEQESNIVDVLLDHGASVSESRTSNFEFESHGASRYPSSPATLEIAMRCQPLHIASCAGSTEIVERFLTAGADINSLANEINGDHRNVTPLMLTCISDNNQMCRLLLSKGANTESRDSCGRTALMYAATSDQENASLYLHLEEFPKMLQNETGLQPRWRLQ
jgi:ankyrin repeat protein